VKQSVIEGFFVLNLDSRSSAKGSASEMPLRSMEIANSKLRELKVRKTGNGLSNFGALQQEFFFHKDRRAFCLRTRRERLIDQR